MIDGFDVLELDFCNPQRVPILKGIRQRYFIYFGIKNIIFIKITLYEEVNGIAKPSDSDIVDPGA